MPPISTTHETDMVLPTKPNHILPTPTEAADFAASKERAHDIFQALNRLYGRGGLTTCEERVERRQRVAEKLIARLDNDVLHDVNVNQA